MSKPYFKIDGDFLKLKAGEELFTFKCVGRIEPKKTDDGEIFTYKPQKKYEGKRDDYHDYCKAETEFILIVNTELELEKAKGVYVWVLDGAEKPSYIGEAKNLMTRFSSGYCRINPRNCFTGGQSTNCKMNHEVLKMWKEGRYFKLFFYKTERYKDIENKLIKEYDPTLNSKGKLNLD